MEIKQGDKVRVSKDAPKEFERFKGDEMNYEVVRINSSTIIIQHKLAGLYGFTLAIPCKYLVKVDAEAKEAKFKKGDKVKYVGKEHPEYWGEVFTVDGEIFYNDYYKDMQIDSVRCEKYNLCNVSLSDLVLYTEPTEQTEAEKTDSDVPFSIFRDELLSNPKIVNLHNGMGYWLCYEANLAKEVALKVANKYNAPHEAAKYAVSVAKAVVEGLKRK